MNTRLAPLALALAALALGCRDNHASLLAYGICAMPEDAAKCSFSGKCDAYVNQTGLDTALATDGLIIGVELHNQLEDNADTGQGGTGGVNTHDAFVRQIEVSYSGGGLSISGRTIDLQDTVPAGGTAVVPITPIDSVSAADIDTALGAGGAANIIAAVKFKGIYGDGSDFVTAAYTIPVHVCSGCNGVPACPTGKALTAVCPQVGQQPLSITCE